MVINTHTGGSSFGSGSGAGTDPIDEQMWEFIQSEITRNILEQTPMIFGTVKEGIMEILEERLGEFHTEIMSIVEDCTFSFPKSHVYGAPE